MLQDLANYYFHQGLRLAKENHITKALEQLKKATALQGENWQALNLQGLCFYELGDFSKAKGAWKRSLTCKNQENIASHYLGEMEQGDFEDLCKEYNQALMLAKLKKYKKAIKILNSKEFASIKITSFQNLLGLCYLAQGKKVKALHVWHQALKIDIDNPYTLRYIQESLGNLEEKSWFAKWFAG
ncbi:Tetratricopeptide TPR_2 repeat protein [Alkaliphilus metalliredigens QYMF]|uniref:Tetratricopeptide TPR_2 repeat protein n=1 Tax=Alkaliphilus metalliredigens (strain QYMF) TaxID=293826 RepID=A6TK00_ALKMQ|nr:tetratricopeptide repeat protein [Alkaliphilus metalliredigens]ABR46518.1 Tetratricopeptide TPR_2 repeat protein [Alkaliphilus metalliredigens QYMF]